MTSSRKPPSHVLVIPKAHICDIVGLAADTSYGPAVIAEIEQLVQTLG
jgi:hypothetical protein